MPTLYVTEQNSVLRKSGDRIRLCKRPPHRRKSPGVREGDILMEWPCADISHVMIFGNVQVTTKTMHHLLQRGVEMALFTRHGSLLGQLTPPAGKNIILRKLQFEKQQDPVFTLNIAKEIVSPKINSCLCLLKDFHKNHPDILDIDKIQRLEVLCDKSKIATNMESLRGFEGSAAELYFNLLGRMLPDIWTFKGRSRQPPKDEPNAVLSFGYVIVGNELQALLDGAGFDPYLGFYHQTDYGRASLALDLLELFRHTLVDRLMLRLFNLSILNKQDFEPAGRGGIYLSASGQKKFFVHYEKMAGMYRGDSPVIENGGHFREYFQECVAALKRTVENDAPFNLDFFD